MDNIEEILRDNGYENVTILKNFDYETALIGVTQTNQAVYGYDMMVEYLVVKENFSIEEAQDWIDYNTISILPVCDSKYPLVLYKLHK